jgi:hypothetical protein
VPDGPHQVGVTARPLGLILPNRLIEILLSPAPLIRCVRTGTLRPTGDAPLDCLNLGLRNRQRLAPGSHVG